LISAKVVDVPADPQEILADAGGPFAMIGRKRL
jgi:hypothetical protein